MTPKLHDAHRELAKWLNKEQTKPIDRVALATVLWAVAAPAPYDQQALELCKKCGWKTMIPGDGCLNCAQARELSDGEIYTSYITATNQTLRPQDERLALAFARAVLEVQKGLK